MNTMRLDIISLTWCDTVLFSSFRVSRRAKDFEQQLERLREVLVLDFSFSLLKLCSVLAGHPSVPAGEMTRCSRVVYDWCHQSASGAFFQSLPTTRTTLRWNWKKNEIYWMKRCNIHHCDAGISCIIKDIVLGTLQGTNRSFAPRRTVYGAGCCEERAGKHLLVQLNCFYSALMGAAFSCLRSLSNLFASKQRQWFHFAFILCHGHRRSRSIFQCLFPRSQPPLLGEPRMQMIRLNVIWWSDRVIRPPPSTPPPQRQPEFGNIWSCYVVFTIVHGQLATSLLIQLSCWKVCMQVRTKPPPPRQMPTSALPETWLLGLECGTWWIQHPDFSFDCLSKALLLRGQSDSRGLERVILKT